MATRSTIALELADGTVKQVYCHWDGYLSNNGMILMGHYTDPEMVERLLDYGDISSLGVDVASTVFYKRDRGETEVDCRVFDSFGNYKKNHQYEEYEYIMRGGVWYVADHSDKFMPLEDAMAQDEECNE